MPINGEQFPSPEPEPNSENRHVEPEEYKNKKTKYFSDFALKNFSTMRILKKGGLLGREGVDWRNIAEHCLTEAVAADILAEHLHADRNEVVEAALLHDWFKRREVESMNQLGGEQGYGISKAEDKKLLSKFNVSKDIIALANANIPESADPDYLEERPIEQKIVHFIDLITSGSEFMNAEDRLLKVEENPRNVEFSDSFRGRYNGKTLFEFQRQLAVEEQDEFENILGLEKGTLISFIEREIEKRTASS
jgi:HD superfamily phosphodiesterase